MQYPDYMIPEDIAEFQKEYHDWLDQQAEKE